MSALFMDGFDHYGTGSLSTTNMQAGPYAAVSRVVCGIPPWGPPRTGTSCLVLQNGNEVTFTARRVLPTPGTHFFVSFGWAADQIYNGNNPYMIAFMDGSENIIAQLGFTSTGVLYVAGPTGTVYAQTSGPVVVAQNWHFFEMEIDTVAHTFTLRVDDAQANVTPILTVTNGSLTGSIAQIALLSGNNGPVTPPTTYMDDLFIRDSNGTTNNGWLGDRRIATLFANADTTTSNWTPSYYHEFGAGILVLSNMVAGSSAVVNPNAFVSAAAASALDIGSADFTLETFVRFDAIPSGSNYSTIFNRWDTTINGRSYRLLLGSQAFNNGCLQFDTSTDGTVSTVSTKILYPWIPLTNTWHHVALVRSAGELLLFVDGQQLGLPIADSSTYYSGGAETFSLGLEVRGSGLGNQWVTGSNLIGRLDETRFTNGMGRYTGPFSAPTAAFPRGSADPNWSQVSLLMGYDSGVIDESSFNRSIRASNGAAFFTPADGAAIGVYSTVNKATPDDNTFISANLSNAYNILTMTTQPANGDKITVGTKDGTVAAVYTFKTAISTAFDVLIDTTPQNTLINFLNAVNAGSGAGTTYGTGTTSNFDVNAVQLPVGQIEVVANLAGVNGNNIASTSTGTAAHWTTPTLIGGASIPGPIRFKFQRPPNNTTIISALQTNIRALKNDAGTSNVQTSFIGALGGIHAGSVHPLTVSANYYADMTEFDPDTSGPLSPTTIVNGQFQINRTS